jgi:hypothetical protein
MDNWKKCVGQEFEEAVFRFARILDPDAEVLFDHTVPDRDTGEPRPCDGWINAKFCDRWPLSILVSCEDHERKLNEGDLGTFLDEIRSTGANTGIIYSRAGFTEPALRKAQLNGIPCCQFVQNEPAEIPEAFYFEKFACLPQVRLDLLALSSNLMVFTWGDIFALDHERGTILDQISKVITESEENSVNEMKNTHLFPFDWEMEINFSFTQSEEYLKMLVNGHWKKYKSRLEAILQDGSYCFNNQSIQGTQTVPGNDSQSTGAGESWAEIKEEDFRLPIKNTITVLNHGKWKDNLQAQLGPKSPFNESS